VAEPGLHAGRHAGCKSSSGDILVYCDDDIRATTGWLEGIAECFDNSDVALAGGNILPEFECNPPEWVERLWIKTTWGKVLGQYSLINFGDVMVEISPMYVWGANFAIKKNVLLELGGFHPDGMPPDLFRFRGDGETFVSRYIQENGFKAVYNPNATVFHWVSRERMTPEYLYKRMFLQGISDSFTYIRNYKRPGELKKYEKRADIIQNTLNKGYCDGFNYHHNEVKIDSELLRWVLRENYFDYRLPNSSIDQENKACDVSAGLPNSHNLAMNDSIILQQLAEFQDSPKEDRMSYYDHTKDSYNALKYYDSLNNRLLANGITVDEASIDLYDFERWLNSFPEIQNHYRHSGDVFIEKCLEHYLTFYYLSMNKNDIYIDVAAAGSPWAGILNNRKIKSYCLDIAYPKGINCVNIGADAANTNLPDNMCTALSLQCAYECFMGDADIRFVKEASRILNNVGRYAIIPFYLDDTYFVATSPYCDQREVVIENEAKKVWRDDEYKAAFSRHYSPEAFRDRIYSNIPDDMAAKIIYFNNLEQVMRQYEGQRVYCFFMLYCEKRKHLSL